MTSRAHEHYRPVAPPSPPRARAAPPRRRARPQGLGRQRPRPTVSPPPTRHSCRQTSLTIGQASRRFDDCRRILFACTGLEPAVPVPLAVLDSRWRAAGLLRPERIISNRPGDRLLEEPTCSPPALSITS